MADYWASTSLPAPNLPRCRGHFPRVSAAPNPTTLGGARRLVPSAHRVCADGDRHRMPAVSMHGRAVLTNTSRRRRTRSAGRLRSMFIIEAGGLIDLARAPSWVSIASSCDGVPRGPRAMLLQEPAGTCSTTAATNQAPPPVFDRASELADWKGFGRGGPRRPSRPVARIGVANYIISNCFPPLAPHTLCGPRASSTGARHVLSSGQARRPLRQLRASGLGWARRGARHRRSDVTVVRRRAHSARALRLAAVG